jgi:hypothetical protein
VVVVVVLIAIQVLLVVVPAAVLEAKQDLLIILTIGAMAEHKMLQAPAMAEMVGP